MPDKPKTIEERIIERTEPLLEALKNTYEFWGTPPGCPDPDCSVCRRNRAKKEAVQAVIKAEEAARG